MNEQTEKRRSFRIMESMHLICEPVSDREFHEGLERRRIRRGASEGLRSLLLDLDARIAERVYLLRGQSSTVAECIALLNDKLNAVVEQLPELRKSKTDLADRPPQLCEISADGMYFGTARDFPVGARLALRFLLVPGNHYIETFCSVTRQMPPPESGDRHHPYGVAVEFLAMPSAQKEIIIRHLFDREAETLRTRREKLRQTGSFDGFGE